MGTQPERLEVDEYHRVGLSSYKAASGRPAPRVESRDQVLSTSQ